MRHSATLDDAVIVQPEIILFSTSAQAQAMPVITATYYGAPNIAAGSFLDMQMTLPVTVLPGGGYAVDLTGLFAHLANFEKPADLSDFMSRMFDHALDHPVVTLVGLTDSMLVLGGPWG